MEVDKPSPVVTVSPTVDTRINKKVTARRSKGLANLLDEKKQSSR